MKTSAVWCALTATGVLHCSIRKDFAHHLFEAAARQLQVHGSHSGFKGLQDVMQYFDLCHMVMQQRYLPYTGMAISSDPKNSF